MDSSLSIIQVRLDNYDEEMKRLTDLLASYNNVCIDTGFTPFVCVTPRGATELVRYEDMKYNTGNCKLFQVGLSLCDDEGKIGGCWQFNLCDPRTYVKGETTSIFHKFKVGFRNIVETFHGKIKWVTFHGMYDLAFLISSVLELSIPSTKEQFLELVKRVFGKFYDLKAMVKHYENYLGPLTEDVLGLGKVTQMVGFKLLGKRHHAGSDSLATSQLLSKFFEWDRSNSRFENFQNYTKFEGILYGISPSQRNHQDATNIQEAVHMRHHNTMYLPNAPMFCYAPRSPFSRIQAPPYTVVRDGLGIPCVVYGNVPYMVHAPSSSVVVSSIPLCC
ncbi:putative CCR4-associated factor 1 homolog 8 [Chenopodium quinoa]|uniref:putative CCR4-associated factor 1 homolog 8 n=1 Tax=Chenopodium quinoa TaxID=63459 RepID=UPI000B76BE1B|nr:putative CCR4-associated factor 1 homolog 8 [Chenopodium quinoa]